MALEILTEQELADFTPLMKEYTNEVGEEVTVTLGYDDFQVPVEGDTEPYEDGPWIVGLDTPSYGYTSWYATRAEAQAAYDNSSTL